MCIRELSYVGLGELLQKLEQLKIKLHQKGWFKTARKKPIPKFPKRIGVVTSPTGAVIQDILNILTRRFSGFHLILNPVKVQGEGAAQEIAKAIQDLNRYKLVDVMIVGRGGGSLEDLWAFNEECVAEAIYHSEIPIICAVGHETDHSIAEYVADVRAPTPSAAAEIVIAEKGQQLQNLCILQKRMRQTLMHVINKDRQRLAGIQKHPLLAYPFKLIEARMQQMDDMREDLDACMRLFLQKQKQLLHSHSSAKIIKRLDTLMASQLNIYKQKLNGLSLTLKAIDPKNLLNKGYSILLAEKEDHVINSVHKLERQQRARIWLSDGEALITINEIISREH
jgi:exodeoxyribonuclease VII large subunit